MAIYARGKKKTSKNVSKNMTRVLTQYLFLCFLITNDVSMMMMKVRKTEPLFISEH